MYAIFKPEKKGKFYFSSDFFILVMVKHISILIYLSQFF